MRKLAIALMAVLVLPVVAQAGPVIEDFEHGNVNLYTQITGSLANMSIIPGAAHNGNLGASFSAGSGPRWYVREDIPTSPGNEYFGYVRFAGGTSGRMYMGLGASLAGGTVSVVAATNTSATAGLLIQNNRPGFGFATLAQVPFTYTEGVWYRMAMEWAANGDVRGKIYNESGNTLLADTPWSAAGLTAGGIALRAFPSTSSTSTATISFDTLTVPEPASLALLGLGLLTLARRRR